MMSKSPELSAESESISSESEEERRPNGRKMSNLVAGN